MSNTKFLNKVKEFAENFNKGYEVSQFKLDKPYENSILLAATIGGSSGGNCWGGHTSDFEKHDSEIQSSLKSDLIYAVSELKEYFKNDIDFNKYVSSMNSYNNIDSQSNDYDYYGNHTKTGLYEFSLYKIMKDCLPDDLFQIFKSYWSNRENVIIKVFEDKKTMETIKNLESKIENFEKDKEEELKKLKNNLQHYKAIIESLEKSLSVFQNKKTTELNDLNSSLDKIKNENEISKSQKINKKM